MGTEDEMIVLVQSNGAEIELSEQQSACVNFEGKNDLVIKGVAGAGKSVVLISSALKTIGNLDGSKPNSVLFVSYTNSLVKYAQEQLDPDGLKSGYVRICTLDQVISELFRDLKFKDKPTGHFIKDDEQIPILKKVLTNRGKASKHRFYSDQKFNLEERVGFWRDEIEWMMSLGIDGSDFNKYMLTPRKGRSHKYNMSAGDRSEAFEIYREFLRETAGKSYTRLMVHMFLDKHRSDFPDKFKFDHIFIDEAQDLPIIDMRTAIALSRKTVRIAMDANQRIYKHHWLMKDLGIPVYSKGLDKSFRSTLQIDQFADVLRRNNEEFLDFDEIHDHAKPSKEGMKPVVIQFDSRDDEKQAIIALVNQLLTHKKETTAILVPTRAQVRYWGKLMSSAQIYHEIIMGVSNNDHSLVDKYTVGSAGLKICTIHSAKGLEFTNVIVPSFNKTNFPSKKPKYDFSSEEESVQRGRNLAYVAFTRARKLLYVSFYNDESMYLKEIDEACEGRPESGVENSLYRFKHIVSSNSGPFSNFEKDLNATTDNNDGGSETKRPGLYYIDNETGIEVGVDSSTGKKIVSIPPDCMNLIKKYDSEYMIPKDSAVYSDPDKYYQTFAKCAELGVPQAQYNLALCLNQGVGTGRSVAVAVEWLIKAVQNGSSDAEDMMRNYEFDWKSCNAKRLTTSFITDAVIHGCRSARLVLGQMSASGAASPLGFRLLKEQAELGKEDAYYSLAYMAEMGKGIDHQDFGYAKYWYLKYRELSNEEKARNAILRMDGFDPSPTLSANILPLDPIQEAVFNETEAHHEIQGPIVEGVGPVNPVVTEVPDESSWDDDILVDFLKGHGYKVTDNRSKGQSIWVNGGIGFCAVAKKLKEHGYVIDKDPRFEDLEKPSKWFKIKKSGSS